MNFSANSKFFDELFSILMNFLANCDNEVRDALERLRGNPWPSLLLAYRSQRACELLKTHLPLFSLWSRPLEDERESLASIDQQLELPRHRQLERPGYPASKQPHAHPPQSPSQIPHKNATHTRGDLP